MENIFSVTPTSKRIEFIDSMRGFTMILVVMCHVAGMCMGIESDISSIHPYLYEFRMPTFFFISGFVLYKSHQVWDISFVCRFLHKKFSVQIVTTFIFFIVFLYINGISLTEGIYQNSKFGYWFTYCLYVYFVVYSLLRCFLQYCKFKGLAEDAIMIIVGFLFYLLFSVNSIYISLPLNSDLKDLLSLNHWGYYLYFIIGTLSRKHYAKLQCYLDTTHVVLVSLIGYFTLNLFYKELVSSHITLFNLITAITGIIIIFSFFRYHQDVFSKSHVLGKCLQYIGRRTLDIYLLHYFMLPVNIYVCTSFLREHPMPLVELTLSLTLTFIVIVTCLFISAILRLSPISAYLLFGVKKK